MEMTVQKKMEVSVCNFMNQKLNSEFMETKLGRNYETKVKLATLLLLTKNKPYEVLWSYDFCYSEKNISSAVTIS